MPTCQHDRLSLQLHRRGSVFFTVNLAERRLSLLTEHIAELRTAFRETRRDHPFTIEAMECCPITSDYGDRITVTVHYYGDSALN
jgi:hypothetical protein